MASIKLEDLYLSTDELKDVKQLVAKKRNIKNYKNKSSNRLYKIFKKQSKNKKKTDDVRDQLKIQHIIFLKANQKISKEPFII